MYLKISILILFSNVVVIRVADHNGNVIHAYTRIWRNEGNKFLFSHCAAGF